MVVKVLYSDTSLNYRGQITTLLGLWVVWGLVLLIIDCDLW